MAIEDIITALAALESEIAGVKKAYDETPDSLASFPCFVNYPLRGTLTNMASYGKLNLHTIVAELHEDRMPLPTAEAKLRPFINRFQEKMAANLTISGTVAAVNEIRYEYRTFLGRTASEDHLGIRFELDVKETGTITVEA